MSPELPSDAALALGIPRRRRAQRQQPTPVPLVLDELVGVDALPRILWDTVQQLDLSAFEEDYIVLEGGPGRAPAETAIVLTLWLCGLSRGVSSARALAELSVRHLDYIWVCGTVSVNYHRLSDFRSQHHAALTDLFVQVIGGLAFAGIVHFEQVSQDGVRVRASAGSSSFHRQETLEAHLEQARRHLAQVMAGQADDDPAPASPPTARQQAARERAARERVARIEAALAEVPALAASLAKRKGKTPKPKSNGQVPAPREPRASSTEPEARVMKMADGGFRPAWNVQFLTDVQSKIAIGVRVTNCGSDMGQAVPMLELVQRQYGVTPKVWLGDGGYASHATIEALTARGCEVLAPALPRSTDPTTPCPGDSAAVAAWRARMATEAAKAAYRARAETSEWVNALARMRYGLQQLRVRGERKVEQVALWVALAHALLRGLALGGRDVFAQSAQPCG